VKVFVGQNIKLIVSIHSKWSNPSKFSKQELIFQIHNLWNYISKFN
jgi:hypothetical protein